MKPTDFKIDDLINHLNGTCQSIQEALPEGMDEDDLTIEDHTAIDAAIFRCETCSWWGDMEEAVETDNGYECKDCTGYEEE